MVWHSHLLKSFSQFVVIFKNYEVIYKKDQNFSSACLFKKILVQSYVNVIERIDSIYRVSVLQQRICDKEMWSLKS